MARTRVSIDSLSEALRKARVYELGKEFHPGMTRNQAHPPFMFSLIRSHRESMGLEGHSSAAALFSLGGHTGTHIDALGHFAEAGRVYGNPEANILEHESYGRGLAVGGIETAPPLILPGVLLDVAALHGVPTLPASHEIGAEDLEAACSKQGVQVSRGSALLIRTGWMRYWKDQPRYCSPAPGVNMSGARWIAERGVTCTGADTSTFEKIDRTQKEVHVLLLARHGVQIMENLYLEELAEEGRYDILFVALPLKIRGATGSPIRPIAVC